MISRGIPRACEKASGYMNQSIWTCEDALRPCSSGLRRMHARIESEKWQRRSLRGLHDGLSRLAAAAGSERVESDCLDMRAQRTCPRRLPHNIRS
eukprot:5252209-Pleurochrysis_carterae.AAC.2